MCDCLVKRLVNGVEGLKRLVMRGVQIFVKYVRLKRLVNDMWG